MKGTKKFSAIFICLDLNISVIMKSFIMFFICFQVARSRELWGICNLPDERTQITFQFGCNVNYFDWWSFWREHLIWILICWAYYAVKGFLSLEQPAFNCSTFSCRNCPFWLMLLVWSNKYLGGGRWPLTTQVEQDKCGCEKSIFSFLFLSSKEGEGRWSQGGEGGGGEAGQRQRPSCNPPWEQSSLVMAMKYSLNDDLGECMDERKPERECKTSGARAWKAHTSRNSSFVGKPMKSCDKSEMKMWQFDPLPRHSPNKKG